MLLLFKLCPNILIGEKVNILLSCLVTQTCNKDCPRKGVRDLLHAHFSRGQHSIFKVTSMILYRSLGDVNTV